MLKKVLLSLLALVAVIVGVFVFVVAMQPSNFRISRSTTISAPPEVVFEQVNDFHNWEAWSPWAKLDPNAKNSFEGSTSGEGAIFRWAGNDEVGEGSMTIAESKPAELVHIKLAFLKPMEATSDPEFAFKPVGDGTEVTWSMYGENGFAGKVICLLMGMQKMMEDTFDKGLASMKKTVEAKSAESTTPAETAKPTEQIES